MALFGKPKVRQLASKRDVQGLLKALRNKDPHVRRAAVEALGKLSDPQLEEALVAVLRDPEMQVQNQAVAALSALRTPGAVSGLIAALPTVHWITRDKIIDSLGEIGSAQALDGLIGELASSDPKILERVALALFRCKVRNARLATALLAAYRRAKVGETRTESFRKYALTLLGEIGDEAARPTLEEAVRDAEMLVRLDAVHALKQLGPKESADVLRRALQDQDGAIRSAAQDALETFVPKEEIGRLQREEWIAARAKDLSSDDPDRRAEAARGLGTAGSGFEEPVATHPHPHARELLLAALEDKDRDVRIAACASLLESTDPPYEALLEVALQAGESEMATHVIVRIAEDRVSEGLPALIAVASSTDHPLPVRIEAIRALGPLGDRVASDVLLSALSDETEQVRSVAAGSLGEIGETRAIEPLTRALGTSIEVESAVALARLGNAQPLREIGSRSTARAVIGGLMAVGEASIAIDQLVRVASKHFTDGAFGAVSQLETILTQVPEQLTLDDLSKVMSLHNRKIGMVKDNTDSWVLSANTSVMTRELDCSRVRSLAHQEVVRRRKAREGFSSG